MHVLCILSDEAPSAHTLEALAPLFAITRLSRDGAKSAPAARHAFVDIDLTSADCFGDVKRWISKLPKERKVIFAVDKGARRQIAQAHALGATTVLPRPIEVPALLGELVGADGALVSRSAAIAAPGSGVAHGVDALQAIFASVGLEQPLQVGSLDRPSEAVVAEIEQEGLAPWVETVRRHHSQTYQHCLLVTGVAAAFATHLGFSSADRRKLTLAALLHDIGKAKIPIAILEKPGPLDPDETAIMRKHPEFGHAELQRGAGWPAEILDLVLHHHELLDGSGYPHGLQASEISDLVRIMTISDVFGALLERRSYKEPLSGPAAFKILQAMTGKLDADIVRALEPVAHRSDAQS
jgi:putative nucleotidyltransferase with HDIG domain